MRYTYENTAAIGAPKDVFLDGVKIDNVSEADTAEGYLVRCKIDAEGFLCVDEDGEIATDRLTGKVVVLPSAG